MLQDLFNNLNLISATIAIVATCVTVYLSIKNYRREQFKTKPKVNITFCKVSDPNSSSTKFDIIIDNKSDYRLYDFKFTKHPQILFFKSEQRKIGFLDFEILVFYPGQTFQSYFGDFSKYKELGINILEFEFEFRKKKNGKKITESFKVNVDSFINTYRMEIKASS